MNYSNLTYENTNMIMNNEDIFNTVQNMKHLSIIEKKTIQKKNEKGIMFSSDSFEHTKTHSYLIIQSKGVRLAYYDFANLMSQKNEITTNENIL